MISLTKTLSRYDSEGTEENHQRAQLLCPRFKTQHLRIRYYNVVAVASVVQWSEFMATDPKVRVRLPALQDFLISSRSGTGSTESREYNCETACKKK
jgi:hypothetical protein